jgi:hypothetical protein
MYHFIMLKDRSTNKELRINIAHITLYYAVKKHETDEVLYTHIELANGGVLEVEGDATQIDDAIYQINGEGRP